MCWWAQLSVNFSLFFSNCNKLLFLCVHCFLTSPYVIQFGHHQLISIFLLLIVGSLQPCLFDFFSPFFCTSFSQSANWPRVAFPSVCCKHSTAPFRIYSVFTITCSYFLYFTCNSGNFLAVCDVALHKIICEAFSLQKVFYFEICCRDLCKHSCWVSGLTHSLQVSSFKLCTL